jgi:hypothetical protein
MSQRDLWDKAAECTRAIEATSDPRVREILIHVRTLWINLANERAILSDAALAEQVAAVTRIHADLTRAAPQ